MENSENQVKTKTRLINLLNYSSEKKRVKSFTKKRKTRLELKVINI